MESSLNSSSVRQVILDNGGKMTNKALVKHFKKSLAGSSNHENRTKFKNIINEIAVLTKDSKGRDLIVLKATEAPPEADADRENQKPEQSGIGDGASMATSAVSMELGPESSGATAAVCDDSASGAPAAVDLSAAEDKSAAGEGESPSENVRERARRFNDMEEQALRERESPAKLLRQATGEGACVCASSNTEEDHTIALDDVKRKWMIMSAKCDYQAMARFLKDHHHLVGWKNFVNGYTALHYAAKFGEMDCIKLLAGTHKAKVNVLNNAGMTPLHMAAMHNRGPAIQLLVQTYKADPNIRDFRGKLPKDYLNDTATRRMSLRRVNLNSMLMLEPDVSDVTKSVEQYLQGVNRTATLRTDTLGHGEGFGGTLTPNEGLNTTSYLLRRSFRVGTGRTHSPMADHRTAGDTLAPNRGGYVAGAASMKRQNPSVTRALSMPKTRGGKRHLKNQKRITSLVEEGSEDPCE